MTCEVEWRSVASGEGSQSNSPVSLRWRSSSDRGALVLRNQRNENQRNDGRLGRFRTADLLCVREALSH
jgi:hypothetical protein